MVCYRKQALEAIARNILKEYDPTLITGAPRAIPIEEIVEQKYHLAVEYKHLRKNGTALGCTVFDGAFLPVYNTDEKHYELICVEAGTIVIDAGLLHNKADGRLRFTVAHELAHWLIHREQYSGTRLAAASAAKTSLEEDTATERQADILATALLMPAGQVKRAYHAAHGENVVEKLARTFDVSKQAMSIFLQNHNLT